MSQSPEPMVKAFADCEPYTQDEPPGASFKWLLKKDQVPGLCMGLVTLEGPIHKTPAAHEEWEQVYVIHSGTGTLHMAGKDYRIAGPSIVVIPKNTMHSMELKAGEKMQYAFVNQYLTS